MTFVGHIVYLCPYKWHHLHHRFARAKMMLLGPHKLHALQNLIVLFTLTIKLHDLAGTTSKQSWPMSITATDIGICVRFNFTLLLTFD